MSPTGPSRHFSAMKHFSRFRSEADIGRIHKYTPNLALIGLAGADRSERAESRTIWN